MTNLTHLFKNKKLIEKLLKAEQRLGDLEDYFINNFKIKSIREFSYCLDISYDTINIILKYLDLKEENLEHIKARRKNFSHRDYNKLTITEYCNL